MLLLVYKDDFKKSYNLFFNNDHVRNDVEILTMQ